MHCNGDNSYLFANGKEFCKFKTDKNVNFPYRFCLESMSDKFDYVESEEVSFKENVYNFSVDYDAFNKSDILNIYKYSMFKNYIK